jgi:hypothetical protein
VEESCFIMLFIPRSYRETGRVGISVAKEMRD